MVFTHPLGVVTAPLGIGQPTLAETRATHQPWGWAVLPLACPGGVGKAIRPAGRQC
jgi:hypothetical protein